MHAATITQTISFRRKPARIQLTSDAESSAVESLAVTHEPVDHAATAAANNQAVVSLLRKVEGQISAADATHQQHRQELQQTAIELALVAAECLASKCTERGQFDVEEMVRRAVESCEPDDAIVVLLNPQDLHLLNESATSPEGQTPASTFKADARINRGECQVVAPSQRLTSTISDRLESIRRAWMESLDDIAA